jgi:DNA transposition AAA+ family ATPase
MRGLMISGTVGKRACVIGDSRTGKTFACDAYRLKSVTNPSNGDTPSVPVIYWHSTTETGQRELFIGLLEHLKYRVMNGTIADLRERAYRRLKACQVEMIILDEAHRFRPKTFSEIRDIFDLLVDVGGSPPTTCHRFNAYP